MGPITGNTRSRQKVRTDSGKRTVPVAPPAPGGSPGGGGGGTGPPRLLWPPFSQPQSPSLMMNSATLQLFMPITHIVASFEIERLNCAPEIPSPIPVTNGYNLISTELVLMQMDLAPDGQTPVYRVCGTYCYTVNDALSQPYPLPFSVPAWANISTYALSEQDFIYGIMPV